MPIPSEQAQTLTQTGLAALRRGDAAAARQAFSTLAAAGATDANVQLGLAYACSALGDAKAARAAVDAALAQEPRHLRALVLKADLLHAAGDGAAALAHYQAALKVTPPEARLPPELQQQVERAQAMCEHYAGAVGAALRAGVDATVSSRFAQSLDLLLGERELYLPRPRLYHFPELPPVQFFERSRLPWLDAVEAATDAIRDELLAVLEGPQAFTPYVQRPAGRPVLRRDGMLDNADWSAFYLWKNGVEQHENTARCPRTMAALAGVPMPRIPGRSPSILFSQLRPGAHIPPHHGFVNTRQIVHLPLIVPPGCAFRVGNETREWVEGRAWAFDDTIEHEAWNRSDRTRVVLLFEAWRPELDAAEREQVGRLFETLDRQRGGADWGI